MKNLLKSVYIFSFLLLFPIITFAQHCPPGYYDDGIDCAPISDIWDLIYQFQDILNSIIPVLIALGVVYFIWGVTRYVIADGEEAKKKGKDVIIYGLIGLTVIFSLWGLVNIIINTFGLDSFAPDIATLTGPGCNFINNTNPKFQDLLCYLTKIINDSVIPLIFALAVVSFVWGAVNFLIINADDEKKREQGRQFMIWGIIALAAMLSIWGLVTILGNTFNIDTSVLPMVKPPL